MITRMFEYVGGGSDKFWEVTYPASSEKNFHHWTVRFGRRGSSGQQKVFSNLGSHSQAIREAESKIGEKVCKGYVEVHSSQRVSAASVIGYAEFQPRQPAAPEAPRRTTRPKAASPPPVSYERPKRKITLG